MLSLINVKLSDVNFCFDLTSPTVIIYFPVISLHQNILVLFSYLNILEHMCTDFLLLLCFEIQMQCNVKYISILYLTKMAKFTIKKMNSEHTGICLPPMMSLVM